MYHFGLRFTSGAPAVETPAAVKSKDAYRNYDAPARDTVREFYRQNHAR